MSDENTLGREPIELVEIVLPRCANVYGVSPCTATGGQGSECYNCRATCQDPDNYRDTPDRHLEGALRVERGDTLNLGAVGAFNLFAAFHVRFSTAPQGIIWEQGSSTNGAYLGVQNGTLIFEILSNNLATVAVGATQFAGKTVVLYAAIDFTAFGSTMINLWVFDPVELTLTHLGSDTITAGAAWTDSDLGGFGSWAGGSVGANRQFLTWNGVFDHGDLYSGNQIPNDMSDNFNASLWLGRGVKGEPTDEQYILPCLQDLSTLGTSINLSGADDNYQPLGRRASLDFTVHDFTHSDVGQDPYVATRPFDPREQSTFWRKWMVRQKFGKVGARVRVYDGYAGQPLSQYQRRGYVLDRVNQSENGVAFVCRDELSRTEFQKAKIPAVSTGLLFEDMTAGQASFALFGDVTSEYPISGTVRIDEEILTYTSRSFSGDRTTFTGVTRGTDGSVADEHDQDDLVQLCRRYVDGTISQTLIEWLAGDAAIPGQLIDIAGIISEDTTFLNAYDINTLLTVPTGVDRLLGRMSEECGFFIYWNERSQRIELKAIRGVDPTTDINRALTDEHDIVAGSFQLTEKPKQRVNILNFYYNPIDFAGALDDAANFRNGLQTVNGQNSLPEQYGTLIQERNIYSIFLSTEAQANQTSSRFATRYADIPLSAQFALDAKDRSLWVGDYVTISTPLVVTETGERDLRRWIILEAEEVDPGHLVRYRAQDATLDGLITRITANGIGNYTPELFEAGNAFITDNNGLNPDQSEGARII